MTDFVIRPFAWADIPAITAIYRHYVEQLDGDLRHRGAGRDRDGAKSSATCSSSGHPLLIAERDGELLGYAYASIYRPRPAYRFTCEDSIYCAPDAPGPGLGTALLETVIDASPRLRLQADDRR